MNPEAVLIPVGFFAMIGFVVWVVANAWRQRAQAKASVDFSTRLLDRISSAADLTAFLQSEQGATLMTRLAKEPRVADPRDRILNAAQTGVVMTILGMGLLLMAWRAQADGGVFVGGVVISLGLGFMVSAAVSYALGQSLGVLRDRAQTSE